VLSEKKILNETKNHKDNKETLWIETTSIGKESNYFRKGKYRASKRNFERRNKTAFGPRGQAEISLKIVDFRSNKTTGKLSEVL
jgi:hypothetical protein